MISRPPLRSLSLRPDDSLTIPRMALSIDSRDSVSFLLTIQATGPLTLALAGLTPAEYSSLDWTVDRGRNTGPFWRGKTDRHVGYAPAWCRVGKSAGTVGS